MHLQTSNREVTTESIKYWYIKGGGVPKLGKCPSCPHLKTYPLPLFWDSKNRIFFAKLCHTLQYQGKTKGKTRLTNQISKINPPFPHFRTQFIVWELHITFSVSAALSIFEYQVHILICLNSVHILHRNTYLYRWRLHL